MTDMIDIQPVSEDSLIIYLGTEIDPEQSIRIGQLSQLIREQLAKLVIEVIPSYTSIFIQYRLLTTDFETLHTTLKTLLEASQNTQIHDTGKLIELPAWYHPESGPDLEAALITTGLDLQTFIDLHSAEEYRVCAIGFAPGFAFLGNVNEIIALPRHNHPRSQVAAGSIGIAGVQTAVYPAESPGGWQIIGNCPVPLFTPNHSPISPFQVGDRVRFTPVDRHEFQALKQEHSHTMSTGGQHQ